MDGPELVMTVVYSSNYCDCLCRITRCLQCTLAKPSLGVQITTNTASNTINMIAENSIVKGDLDFKSSKQIHSLFGP